METPAGQTYQILLVDDDVDMRKLFRKRLEIAGYGVVEAVDGEQALTSVAAQPPDLIILDVMLPKVNGYEVCAKLKKGRATRQIPIVMFTAKGAPHEQFEGIKVGADSYISKLCPAEDLLERVRMWLPSSPRSAPSASSTS